jgi:GTP-binding protein
MPKPLIAIVGRPNVGKSTLFNRLARKRIAVVEDFAGTTRDRLYADCDIWGRTCTLIDTGGFDLHDKEGYAPSIVAQAQIAIEEADVIVFVLDGREEPTTLDFDVAELLRRTRKPVILAANKIDNPNRDVTDIYQLRLGAPVVMSAVAGHGVAELTEQIEENLPRPVDEEITPDDGSIKVALIGRPNVGKSALTNKILGFERSMVSPVAGTTRDAIDTKFTWKDREVTLIDTAGMRRKARVRAEKTATEYHMVLRSLRAVDRCDVVILVCEAGGITDQDAKIAGYAHEAGKAVLIAVNKWDLIESSQDIKDAKRADHGNKKLTEEAKAKLNAKLSAAQKDFAAMVERYLPFISYAPQHFTSAVSGYNVEKMFDDALDISKNVTRRIPPGQLNDTVRRAIAEHAIPSAKGRQMKIRYATQAEISPPTLIIFCNHPEQLHFSYVRYLENAIRKKFDFRGVPLRVELRKGSGERTAEERLAGKKAAAMIEDREKYGGDIAPEWEELAARARALEELESDEFDDFPEIVFEGEAEDDDESTVEIDGVEVVQETAPTTKPKKSRVNPTRNAHARARKTGPDMARSGGKNKKAAAARDEARTRRGTNSAKPGASSAPGTVKRATGGKSARGGRASENRSGDKRSGEGRGR